VGGIRIEDQYHHLFVGEYTLMKFCEQLHYNLTHYPIYESPTNSSS
jgi:hypothetical protein